MSKRFATLLMLSLASTACVADTIPASVPPFQPATYGGFIQTSSVFQFNETNSPITLQYSSPATANLPFEMSYASAGANEIAINSGIASVSNGTDAGDGILTIVYARDKLYLTGAPQEGYFLILASVQGYNLNDSATTSAPGSSSSPSSQALFEVAAGYDEACSSTNTVFGNCGDHSGIPGLTQLYVPYDLDADDTTPFSISLETYDVCQTSGIANCSAQSFFSDATVHSITVTDIFGRPVEGATVTSLAGINYDTPVVMTPEPSSLLLIGTGTTVFLAFVRSRLAGYATEQ